MVRIKIKQGLQRFCAFQGQFERLPHLNFNENVLNAKPIRFTICHVRFPSKFIQQLAHLAPHLAVEN